MKYIEHLLWSAAAGIVPGAMHAQNLVQDPGFEQNSACPVQVSDLSALPLWWSPNMATTDYYHSCSPAFGSHVPYNMAGVQWPHGGDAYAGIITQANDLRYSELIQGHLSEPLKKGSYYRVSYHVALADIARIKDKRLGVCFTVDSTSFGTRTAPACPKGQVIMQMTVPAIANCDDWNLVTGMYKAKGGERFITLGNFQGSTGRKDQEKNKSSQTHVSDRMGYYYIDDVAVEKARNRTDTAHVRQTATSTNELTAKAALELAPCSALFKPGSSAFLDIKAVRAAAQQDTGSVPPMAMLEYLGDLLVREEGLIMEIAVHSAPMADTLAARTLSEARARALVARFKDSGVHVDHISGVGIATALDAQHPLEADDDGVVRVRIVRNERKDELAREQAD